MVEKLFTLEYGVAGVCVLLTVVILMKCAEYVLKIREKKETTNDEAMKMVLDKINHFERRFDSIDGQLSILPKMKLDVKRSFDALKIITGDKWKSIFKEIKEAEEEDRP